VPQPVIRVASPLSSVVVSYSSLPSAALQPICATVQQPAVSAAAAPLMWNSGTNSPVVAGSFVVQVALFDWFSLIGFISSIIIINLSRKLWHGNGFTVVYPEFFCNSIHGWAISTAAPLSSLTLKPWSSTNWLLCYVVLSQDIFRSVCSAAYSNYSNMVETNYAQVNWNIPPLGRVFKKCIPQLRG